MSDGGAPSGEASGQGGAGGWGRFAVPVPGPTGAPSDVARSDVAPPDVAPPDVAPPEITPPPYGTPPSYGTPPWYGPPSTQGLPAGQGPPWGPGPVPPAPTPPPTEAWAPKPIWLLALTPIGALVGAAGSGVAAGVVVYLLAGGWRGGSSSSGEGWDQLGYAIVGFLAGMLVGAVSYVVLLAVAARRLIPPGRRAGAVVVATIGSPVLLALAGVLTGIGGSGRAVASGSLQLAWLAAAPVVFVVSGRGLVEQRPRPGGPERRLVTPSVIALGALAGLLVVAVVLGGVGFARSSADNSKAVRALPLVLFTHSGDLDYHDTPPVAGWRREPLTTTYVHSASSFAGIGTPGASEAYLTYVTPQGAAFVTMHESLGPCSAQPVRGFACEVVRMSAVGEIRRYVHTTSAATGALPAQEYLAKVHTDGTAVSVSMDSAAYPAADAASRAEQEAEAMQVLNAAVRVSRHQFEDVAHTRLKVV